MNDKSLYRQTHRRHGKFPSRARIPGAEREPEVPAGFAVRHGGPRPGVYARQANQPPLWLCGPLTLLAHTRDDDGGRWGRLLVWRDREGCEHQWAMPAELTCGDGLEIARVLTRGGLLVASGRTARAQLCAYLMVGGGHRLVRCTSRTGWRGATFVLPDQVIGPPQGETVFLQSDDEDPAARRPAAGTLPGWRTAIALPAQDNSRLVFVLSLAFAAPLADAAQESGGFHLVGPSSCGKSTALAVAASVWGAPAEFIAPWRSTLNGLEGICARRCDLLLVLDELAQIDPLEAGEAAYLIANGQGKLRAQREGGLRQALRWRVLLLSAGEISLAEHMRAAGKACRAGQDIRLLDIAADAGTRHGLFDVLQGEADGAALSRRLREAALQHYGVAGRAYLARLVMERDAIDAEQRRHRDAFVAAHAPSGASGQALRAAARFALWGFAGELASRWELTGWPAGHADHCAARLYHEWLQARGGGDNRELHDALAAVRLFLEQHGDSRFTPWDAPHTAPPTAQRAGFRRTDQQGCWHYLFTGVFQNELGKELPAGRLARAMHERGWLKRQSNDRYTVKTRLPGMGGHSTTVYLVTPKIWEDD